jgi:phospholipase C
VGLALLACGAPAPAAAAAARAIRHVVVVFQENRSFDHYFGTYPRALNPPGEPRFAAARGTPAVNGLARPLLTPNPNSVAPFRLDRGQAFTCVPGSKYTHEQQAFDGGLMDRFVENTFHDCTADPSIVMGHFDGNTVTALWNYAQHFTLSDDFHQSTFGPSTPGAINLVSGQTHGATPADVPKLVANGTILGDVDPAYDGCSGETTAALSGTNVGDLLSRAHVTWGWFQDGFAPTDTAADGRPVCGSAHPNVVGQEVTDYIPHHEPFQYYASTANPLHLAPASAATVGSPDPANHQYDLSWFWRAAAVGHQPAVSFLKASHSEDGHPGFSDPLDEQRFLVSTINRIERLPTWRDTVVVIAYDDPGGWYDHQMPPIVNPSADPAYDALSAPGACGTPAPGAYPDRCGYGARLPLLVVSPFARPNHVDHTLTDQGSLLRFIEDNWHLGRLGDQSFDARAGSIDSMLVLGRRRATPPVFLDPLSGMVRHSARPRRSP